MVCTLKRNPKKSRKNSHLHIIQFQECSIFFSHPQHHLLYYTHRNPRNTEFGIPQPVGRHNSDRFSIPKMINDHKSQKHPISHTTKSHLLRSFSGLDREQWWLWWCRYLYRKMTEKQYSSSSCISFVNWNRTWLCICWSMRRIPSDRSCRYPLTFYLTLFIINNNITIFINIKPIKTHRRI